MKNLMSGEEEEYAGEEEAETMSIAFLTARAREAAFALVRRVDELGDIANSSVPATASKAMGAEYMALLMAAVRKRNDAETLLESYFARLMRIGLEIDARRGAIVSSECPGIEDDSCDCDRDW